MIAHRVEGIVIAPVSDRSKGHLRRLAKFGVPFVLVDRTVPGIDVDAVLGDSFGGARQLVEHLISLGHRRIGFIVESDEVSTARDRRRGYESALGRGRRSRSIRRSSPRPRSTRAGASRACGGCSQLDDPPTAVFTVNNLVALGAIEAVRDGRARGSRRRGARLLRRHRVRLAALSVPDRDGAAGGDVRDAGHAAPARSHRGPRARARSAWSSFPAQFVVRKSCGASLSARTAHDRLRRDRGRRLEVGVRGRHRARRPARGGDDSDDDSRGDDRPGRRLLRARGPGRGDRDRLVRPPRPEAVVADLGPHHDDAEAGLGAHRRRARRSAGGSRCRSPSTPTSTRPRSASTAGAPPRGSTRSATSRSAPGSAAAGWSAESCCTASCIPSSGTCASRTTATPTRSRASARTTATAGKGSRRAVRSRRAGAGRPPSSPTTAVWELEARYLALGLVSVISVLSPERIVLGGGVMTRPGCCRSSSARSRAS